MRIEPGTIYVASPKGELSLEGDELRVTELQDSQRPRHTIDTLFRSLARGAGPMAIGVVLSGSGSDGTLGLQAIKEQGGITFVQEPSTASQPSMPKAAIDAGCADVSLTAAEIGDELMRLGAHPYVGRARVPKLIEGEASGAIFAKLRSACGVDFTLYKPGTVDRRIGRRMALHKLERVEDYVSLLQTDAQELRSLYNDLLIGVTSFFRDGEPFDALKHLVFPRMLGTRSTDSPIRVWAAGCSTGEEAYSVAIAILEYLGERAAMYKIQIFGTDVDEDALARAPRDLSVDDRARRFARAAAALLRSGRQGLPGRAPRAGPRRLRPP